MNPREALAVIRDAALVPGTPPEVLAQLVADLADVVKSTLPVETQTVRDALICAMGWIAQAIGEATHLDGKQDAVVRLATMNSGLHSLLLYHFPAASVAEESNEDRGGVAK